MIYNQHKYLEKEEIVLTWVAKGMKGVLAIHCVRPAGVNAKIGQFCNSKCT